MIAQNNKGKILISLMLILYSMYSILISMAGELGSVNISYRFDNSPIPYVNWELRQLASIDSQGNFETNSEYVSLGFDSMSTIEDWHDAYSKLIIYVDVYNPSIYMSDEIDDLGRSTIANIPEGIYLISFEKTEIDGVIYTSNPTLFTIYGENSYISISPKIDIDDAEDDTIRLDVLKIWRNDSLLVRPDEITITLYNGSEKYEKVSLYESNDWSYTWENLDPSGVWRVLEDSVEGYEASYEIDGLVIYIKNTYKTPEDSSDSELGNGVGSGGGSSNSKYDTDVEGSLTQTGALLWPIPLLFGAGAIFIASGLLLRKKS